MFDASNIQCYSVGTVPSQHQNLALVAGKPGPHCNKIETWTWCSRRKAVWWHSWHRHTPTVNRFGFLPVVCSCGAAVANLLAIHIEHWLMDVDHFRLHHLPFVMQHAEQIILYHTGWYHNTILSYGIIGISIIQYNATWYDRQQQFVDFAITTLPGVLGYLLGSTSQWAFQYHIFSTQDLLWDALNDIVYFNINNSSFS